MNVLVVGGGCIGLSIAARLSRDHTVVLHEKDQCGMGASRAAAGMIAPVMEVEYGEIDLLKLALEGHQIYPDYVNSITSEIDASLGFRDEGTLGVAVNESQSEDLSRLFDYQDRLDLGVERISTKRAREIEPRLSSYLQAAVFCGQEYQIDNRQLVSCLKELSEQRGCTVRENDPVREISYNSGGIKSVETEHNSLEPDTVLIAAGVHSNEIDGLSEEDRMPIRPVKGQALSIRLSSPPEIKHVIRSPDVYCVPKDDGRMIVGATMEEEGYDETVTSGAMLDLLHEAYELLPFIYENELLETWAGLRPASRDSKPIIGPSSRCKDLVFATGHYRNGILLTPITVELVEEWIRSRTVPELMEPFLPSRFQEEE